MIYVYVPVTCLIRRYGCVNKPLLPPGSPVHVTVATQYPHPRWITFHSYTRLALGPSLHKYIIALF